MVTDTLADFDKQSTCFGELTYDVYTDGAGPAVIVMPEIPGITPAVANFARELIKNGFTAWIPSLFGTPGKPPNDGYGLVTLAKACVRREFLAFARGKRAPITDWMRELAHHAHEQCGGPGVGVVGMCFTGNYALALAVDPLIKVPVMSQPSLPMGVTPKRRADIHVAPDDLAAIKDRIAAPDDDLCVIGLRFTRDFMVPDARFANLRSELGDGFVGVEIDSKKGNEHGFGLRSHSVLTEEYVDDPDHPTNKAFELVLDHLRTKLHT